MTVLPLAAIGLTKQFGPVTALNSVDVEIANGSITALVGPNGAGKSTLLRTWVGFERPTAGDARVFGFDPWRERTQALNHLGYMPQTNPLYADLTADDHFAFVGRYRRLFDATFARRRLDGLGIDVRRPVRKLSGGERAQVMLTIALGARAGALLLDEPVASLDPLARREFLYQLAESVRDDARTAVLSSHVIGDLEAACDHVLIIKNGRVLLHAPIDIATSTHSVVGSAVAPAERVGVFREPNGEETALIARPAGNGPTSHGATLEQVVLGYLAGDNSHPS